MNQSSPKRQPGRPKVGPKVNRLILLAKEVSDFLSAEKARTGKPLNRIVEDLVRAEMAARPTWLERGVAKLKQQKAQA